MAVGTWRSPAGPARLRRFARFDRRGSLFPSAPPRGTTSSTFSLPMDGLTRANASTRAMQQYPWGGEAIRGYFREELGRAGRLIMS